jgi:hypothetical protein
MKFNFRSTGFLAAILVSVVAGAVAAAAPHAPASPATRPAATAPGHDGHAHAAGAPEPAHAGPKHDLGKQAVAGYTLQVSQLGAVTAGEEAIFIITVSGGTGEPKAIRAWVGVESGEGSIRTAAEEEKEGEWHAHHKVSKPLPAKSKLWLEVESAAGKKKASLDFKP